MKKLSALFIPICFETLFYMLSGMVDTLMLSSVGDYAVGAVGTANSYIGMFIIMFSIISSGMMTVMTQNIGAGRPGIAYQARQLGLIFNSVIGMGMSIFLFIFSENILDLIGIAGNLREPAMSYLEIVGGGCFLNLCKLPQGIWTYKAASHRYHNRQPCKLLLKCSISLCAA